MSERKFEIHKGDVLVTYVRPENKDEDTEFIDGPFDMLCGAVRGRKVELIDLTEPTRRYEFDRRRVEAGRSGMFVFNKPEQG